MCAVWGHNYCKLQSSDALLICCLVLRDARRMSDLQASVKNTLSGCVYGMRACVCVSVRVCDTLTWNVASISPPRLCWPHRQHRPNLTFYRHQLKDYSCDSYLQNIIKFMWIFFIHIEKWYLTSWLIKIFIHNKSSGKIVARFTLSWAHKVNIFTGIVTKTCMQINMKIQFPQQQHCNADRLPALSPASTPLRPSVLPPFNIVANATLAKWQLCGNKSEEHIRNTQAIVIKAHRQPESEPEPEPNPDLAVR